MNLAEVMQEIAGRLEPLAGVRVHAQPPGSIVPPAAVVSYPEAVNYHQTYQSGMSTVTGLQVWLVVGKVTDRAARNALGAYTSESGAESVKALLEADGSTTWDDLTVTGVEFDVITIAAVDYMAAGFTMNLACQGGI